MPYDLAEAAKLAEKKITVVYTIEGENEALEVEGTLMAAAEMGIMLRQRGHQQGEFVHSHQIESIVPLSTANKKITQKLLKPILLDDARAHLADRHGYTLSQVNEMTGTEALSLHDNLDHSDLGHKHSEE